MLKLAIKPIAMLAITVSSFGCAYANEINTQALDLASQKNFDQALQLLSQESAETQTRYEHRFLKARILSWAGQYGNARTELNQLITEYPGNPDLKLAMGNLEYYQNNLMSAESYYQSVLDKFPNYEDARNGLENVRKAKANAVVNGSNKWRIDGGVGVSDFKESDLENWNNQFLRVEYTPDELAYHASVQRYNRFNTTNVQIQGGISDAVRGGWDWGVEAGFTPDALFRPDFNVGGRLGRSIKFNNGNVIYPSVTYRYDDYAAGGIHNIQPELTTYLDKGIVLTGRLIGTLQDNDSNQLGWLVQGRMPATDKLQVNLGYAKAPEAVNGVAISTQTIFGGLSYAVRDDLDFHLNLARDDREDTYIRNSVNVGFTHRR